MDRIAPTKAYRLLEAGPIVLVTTRHDSTPNIMTMGFHMMIQHAPPLIGCIIGPWDHSYKALRETGECVIAVPTVDLARKVVKIGNCSGAETDKFKKFRLTPLPAAEVGAPLVAECLANIECRVADTSLVRQIQSLHSRSRRDLDRPHAQGTPHAASQWRWHVHCRWPRARSQGLMVQWKQFQVPL